MTSTKPSTMSKIWVCPNCDRAVYNTGIDPITGYEFRFPHEYHEKYCGVKGIPHIPVSAVIEMIDSRIKYLKNDLLTDTDSSVSQDNMTKGGITELEYLKKQIEGIK